MAKDFFRLLCYHVKSAPDDARFPKPKTVPNLQRRTLNPELETASLPLNVSAAHTDEAHATTSKL